jgi:hypothetical protein
VQHQIRQGGGEIATVVKLAQPLRAIVHRGAGIHQQVGPKVRLLFVLFDEIAVKLAVSFPVNVADFIPWSIFPMFGKLHTITAIGAVVQTTQQALDYMPRPQ